MLNLKMLFSAILQTVLILLCTGNVLANLYLFYTFLIINKIQNNKIIRPSLFPIIRNTVKHLSQYTVLQVNVMLNSGQRPIMGLG